MKNLFITILVIKLLLTLNCQLTFGQAEIEGYVKWSLTGVRPVGATLVEVMIDKPIMEKFALIDSMGLFKLKNLKINKKYKLRVHGFGYEDQFFEVKTQAEITNVNLIVKIHCEYNEEQAENDWKNGKAKLLLVGSIAPTANAFKDNLFERRYKVRYYDFGCTPPANECIKLYNEQVFKLMDEKYGKNWRKNVRTDVRYLK